MNNPEYVKIEDRLYKINTDFRIGLKCQEIALDDTIDDIERSLAIIYLLFGDDVFKNESDQVKLVELAIKYLKCGEEDNTNHNEKPDMDILQDIRLIEASFKSDYGITLSESKMHWWDFYTYLNGLTENCVLNRVRSIRSYDISDVKDKKQRNKIIEMKKRFALKEKERPMTKKQIESVNEFYELTGINRGDINGDISCKN